MDRHIVYNNQIILEIDELKLGQDIMVALGMFAQTVFGTPTLVDGFTCTPTGPASLNVLIVGPGTIYEVKNLEATAISSLAQDLTHSIVKQGIRLDNLQIPIVPPATVGFSQYYLIQMQYADSDTDVTVLPYFNAANIASQWNGPNNSGVAQVTERRGVVTIQAKAGIAAATGAQVAPAPDAGFTGMFLVLVANGQATITAGNITGYASAPVLAANGKLPLIPKGVQNSTWVYAVDTGTANNIVANTTPPITAYTAGQGFFVLLANDITGATVANFSGLGNKAVVKGLNDALQLGDYRAGQILALRYDGVNLQTLTPIRASTFFSRNAIGAFINKFRNATCLIAARGTSITITAGAAAAYTLDGFPVSCTGANVTVAQVASAGNGARAPNGIRLLGQAGVTGVRIFHIFESVDIAQLAGKNVMFQVKLLNNNGVASVTPTLTIKHPTTLDTGATAWNASVTDVNAVALQAAPTGQMTQLSWAGQLNANAINGLSLMLDFGTVLNGAASGISLFDWDIREAEGDTKTPPIPELRPYFLEYSHCQRHLPSYAGSPYLNIVGNSNQVVDGSSGVIGNGTPYTAYIAYRFPSAVRAAPTGITVSAVADFEMGNNVGGTPALSSLTFVSAGFYAGELNVVSSVGTNLLAGGSTMLFATGANSRMYWTGSELNGSAI